MTAIAGYVAPEAKSGDLGVHSLDQFVLAVPDATVAQDFYGNFGLDVVRDGNTLAIKTFGHHHRWGSVVEGGKAKALHHLSFGCYAEDLPRLKARIEGAGVKLIDPPPGFESNGIWFRNHEGVLMEIKVAPKVSPDAKSDSQWLTVPGGVAAASTRAAAPPVQPRRLSHVLIFTSDVLASISFYERTLGLRLSDRASDLVAFMHGIHGSDHHMLALVKSSAPGFHHCSWDVSSINDIGLGAMRMARQGLHQGLGPRPSRARLQLLPLRARPVGQLLGIFLRHRLHPEGRPLGIAPTTSRKTRSISGVRKCRASSPSTAKPARAEPSPSP